MTTLVEMVEDFLAQERIAVAGVSRKGDIPANSVYKTVIEEVEEGTDQLKKMMDREK